MSVDVQLAQSRFEVHEPCTLDLRITSSLTLVRGDTIEVQFPNSWSLVSGPSHTRDFQTDNVGAAHYIEISADAPQAVMDVKIRARHLNHPAGKVRHGRHIVATLRQGTLPAGTPIRVLFANTFAPYIAETETIWVRVKGEAPAVAPALTVTAGPVANLRVIAPSGAAPGTAFDVVIVALDRFDNPASTHYEHETLTTLDGRVVARWLTFAGRTRVAVKLDQAGVYRFRFRDAVSNAVRVAEGLAGPYWGDLHIHTKLSHDGHGTQPHAYARDVSALHFAATCDHWESLGESGYRQTLEWARQALLPGRYISMFADERNPPDLGGAHHTILFRDEETFCTYRALRDAGLFAPGEGDRRPEPDPSRVMLIPHHTGISFGDDLRADTALDWRAGDDRGLRQVIEIYSHHGQSEQYAPQHALAYEFNRLRGPERRANTSVPGPHYAQDLWMEGRRLGVLASSDDHAAQGGRRHQGIAAVFAPELAREALFDAIRARRCYGTTGERILLDFTVDDEPMGGVLTRAPGSALTIRLRVWGTDTLLRVEILRFRFRHDPFFAPIASVFPQPEALDAEIAISDEVTGPCLYYARVVQEPVARPGMAWSSPIWIEVE